MPRGGYVAQPAGDCPDKQCDVESGLTVLADLLWIKYMCAMAESQTMQGDEKGAGERGSETGNAECKLPTGTAIGAIGG